MGGLPVAVEILIGIDPLYGRSSNDPTDSADQQAITDAATVDMTEYTYRLVIKLPVARPPSLEESIEGTGEETTTTTP